MIELKKLWDSMPRDVQRKISLHDLKRTTDAYNADPLREAARYAMQRMETIRETHPEIALDEDIERIRKALSPGLRCSTPLCGGKAEWKREGTGLRGTPDRKCQTCAERNGHSEASGWVPILENKEI